MRVIKFRGKRLDNGEWVYGDYYNIKGTGHIIANGYYQGVVDPATVGQFTGRTDENQVDIYDGERVYCEDADKCDTLPEEDQPCATGTVKWDEPEYEWVVEWDDGSTSSLRDVDIISIGNIHDKEVKS